METVEKKDLLGAQDHVAVACCVFTRFALLSTASLGIRDTVD